MIDTSTPIIGPPLVTHKQAVDTFIAKRVARRTGHDTWTRDNGYTRADLNAIFRTYAELCAATGVSFGVAVAQVAHETGWLTSWWSARPRRNGCGYGVTGATYPNQPRVPAAWDSALGKWRAGVSFATWDESASAHIGRLLAYAVLPETVTPIQQNLIMAADRFRPIPTKIRGSAPSLLQLGQAHNPSGAGWACPGTTYGAAIAQKIRIIAAA